jgi:hypothetical protein
MLRPGRGNAVKNLWTRAIGFVKGCGIGGRGEMDPIVSIRQGIHRIEILPKTASLPQGFEAKCCREDLQATLHALHLKLAMRRMRLTCHGGR